MQIVSPDKTINTDDLRDLDCQEHQITDYYQVQMLKKLVPFVDNQKLEPEVLVNLKTKADADNLIRAIIEADIDYKESFDINQWIADNHAELFIDAPAVQKAEPEVPYDTLKEALRIACSNIAALTNRCYQSLGNKCETCEHYIDKSCDHNLVTMRWVDYYIQQTKKQ